MHKEESGKLCLFCGSFDLDKKNSDIINI
jgi:hypothetical protein